MKYCSYTSDLASITSHIHTWVLFLLSLHLFILYRIISPLISSSILGTHWTGESSLSVLSFCLFILFMGFSRQDYWSGLPFPSPVDNILSEISTMTNLSWVALHRMVHSFIELDKAVVHVIRLISFLWLWFMSVCPLMPSLSAYRLTGISLTLDMWCSSLPLLLTLDVGISSRHSSSMQPPFAAPAQ